MSEISPTYIAARRALLDALDALADHLHALILVGAQAIYLHTGDTDEAVAPLTIDGDMAVDPDLLGDDPKLEDALGEAGFALGESRDPGKWFNSKEVEVDLLVPASVALGGGTRSVELPPHSSRTTRRAQGLEGVLVDKAPFRLAALESGDDRAFEIAVAGRRRSWFRSSTRSTSGSRTVAAGSSRQPRHLPTAAARRAGDCRGWVCAASRHRGQPRACTRGPRLPARAIRHRGLAGLEDGGETAAGWRAIRWVSPTVHPVLALDLLDAVEKGHAD
ncbi:MAG: hypothetical protein U0R24_00065 [Solirubrobacterales bacterium]